MQRSRVGESVAYINRRRYADQTIAICPGFGHTGSVHYLPGPLRRSVASHEDDSIHLEGSVSAEQAVLVHKLALIDRWSKALTAIAVLCGLLIAGVYLYQVWNTVPTY